MISTPDNPIAAAIHRLISTCSLSSTNASPIITNGATNVTDVASATGIMFSPMIKVMAERAAKTPRMTCKGK